MFYEKLEPYGDWVETSDYGYVYRPRGEASPQWRPYTDGRWAYTDAGWTWISEEPFVRPRITTDIGLACTTRVGLGAGRRMGASLGFVVQGERIRWLGSLTARVAV